MQRLAVAVAVALVLGSSAAAAPTGGREFFPLGPRSEWTYDNLRYGGTETVTAARAVGGTFRLTGFPGAPSLRVRWSGQTLQAWDRVDRRWEAWLRLGAPAGTSYAVDLPQPLWAGVRVTVASRRATVPNPVLRRSYAGALRLSVSPSPELADAGLIDLWFAPRVGLVRWTEQSIAGPVVYVLARR